MISTVTAIRMGYGSCYVRTYWEFDTQTCEADVVNHVCTIRRPQDDDETKPRSRDR